MKATIETITVTVGAHKLTLTLAEAKALRETLNETLGKEIVFPYTPPRKEYVPLPYPVRDRWTAPPSPSPFWYADKVIGISDNPHRLQSTFTA